MIINTVACAFVALSIVSVQGIPVKTAEKKGAFQRVAHVSRSPYNHMGSIETRWKGAKRWLDGETALSKEELEVGANSKSRPNLRDMDYSDTREVLKQNHAEMLGFHEVFSDMPEYDFNGRRRMSALARADKVKNMHKDIQVLH